MKKISSALLVKTALIFSVLTMPLYSQEATEEMQPEPSLEVLQEVSAEQEVDFTTEAEVQKEAATALLEIQSQLLEASKRPAYVPLDLPGSERPEVEKFRSQYLRQPKVLKRLASDLERAQDYRIYVRKAIIDADLPLALEYLPMIESNYNPNARSRSGAIGLWQFMANSVSNFLVLNDFVDERYDPWKETEAAIKKLQENYRYFKDWPLAIGAYNCGLGAMSKALKKAPQKDFWYLASHHLISQQTADYVPKLLAIADIATNSRYYGVDIPDHSEEYEVLVNEKEGNFDWVYVKKAYSINQLAQEMKMDSQTLKKLNPSYVRGMTHPAKESRIRLPLGMEKSAAEAISRLKPIEFPFKYTVEKGDSLWAISRKFGVTVSSLCEINDISENAILKIGKILYIPSK